MPAACAWCCDRGRGARGARGREGVGRRGQELSAGREGRQGRGGGDGRLGARDVEGRQPEQSGSLLGAFPDVGSGGPASAADTTVGPGRQVREPSSRDPAGAVLPPPAGSVGRPGCPALPCADTLVTAVPPEHWGLQHSAGLGQGIHSLAGGVRVCEHVSASVSVSVRGSVRECMSESKCECECERIYEHKCECEQV